MSEGLFQHRPLVLKHPARFGPAHIRLPPFAEYQAMNENIRDLAAKISFLVVLAILVVAFLFMMRPFLFPALFASLVVIICNPLYKVLERRLRHRRYIASLAATLFVSLCVLAPLALIVWTIISNAAGLVTFIRGEFETGEAAQFLDNANAWVKMKLQEASAFLPPAYKDFNVREMVLGGLQSASKAVYQYSSQVLTATAKVLWSLVLVIVFIFVLFAEGSHVAGKALSLLPLSEEHKNILTREVRVGISAIFIGMIATALAQAFLLGIGYWIAGVSKPVLWALVAALVTLIPVAGAPLMYVPTSISLLFGGRWGAALFLLLYGVCIVSVVDNIIKPFVMRERVNVHPLMLALSLVGGTLWAGPAGIVVGPLLVALMLSMLRTYQREFM